MQVWTNICSIVVDANHSPSSPSACHAKAWMAGHYLLSQKVKTALFLSWGSGGGQPWCRASEAFDGREDVVRHSA